MPDNSPEPSNFLTADIQSHYDLGQEAQRLSAGGGLIEQTRTQELLDRYLPPPPAVIYDVGGAAGVYALWLAKQGYEVYLLDPMPLHVEQARQASLAQPNTPLADIELGDARKLPRPDASVDVVLMFGPLYHLIDRADRLTAWREARRVVRQGGLVLAATVNRFASLLDGMKSGFLDDPYFGEIVAQGLTDG